MKQAIAYEGIQVTDISIAIGFREYKQALGIKKTVIFCATIWNIIQQKSADNLDC